MDAEAALLSNDNDGTVEQLHSTVETLNETHATRGARNQNPSVGSRPNAKTPQDAEKGHIADTDAGDKHVHRSSCHEIIFNPSKKNVEVCMLFVMFSFILNCIYLLVQLADPQAKIVSISVLFFLPFMVSTLWSLWLMLQIILTLEPQLSPNFNRKMRDW